MKSDSPLRLSHTQLIEREPTFTEGEFTYELSPDARTVLFGFETFSGDLMHGKTLVVSIDGTQQQILNENCVLANDFEYGWTTQGAVVYITDSSQPENPDTFDDPSSNGSSSGIGMATSLR